MGVTKCICDARGDRCDARGDNQKAPGENKEARGENKEAPGENSHVGNFCSAEGSARCRISSGRVVPFCPFRAPGNCWFSGC